MVFSPALAHPAGLHGAPAWISNTRFILKDEDSKCTCVLRRPRSGSGLGRGATARPAARAQDTVLTLCQRLPGSYMGISQICTPGLLTRQVAVCLHGEKPGHVVSPLPKPAKMGKSSGPP